MDLFKPLVKEKNLHKNFLALRNDVAVQKVLNSWLEDFKDRDNKIIKEFQTTFNSSFWEFYLFACFKELGFSFDFSKAAPDFHLRSKEGNEFFVEAVITNNASNEMAEWDRETIFNDPKLLEEYTNHEKIITRATPRILQALNAKFEKYEESYSKREECNNNPFVIALGTYEQPFFYTQNTNAIRRVLYTYDVPEYIEHNGEREILGNRYVKAVKKANGTDLDLGLFLKPEFSGVSAVIFSNVATSGKARVLSKTNDFILVAFEKYNDKGLQPITGIEEISNYKESLLEGINIFHNPYAIHPLSIEEFDHPDITHHYYNPDKEEFYTKIRHEALFYRIVFHLEGQLKQNKNTMSQMAKNLGLRKISG
ncbi:hypothetical protein ABH897_004694 [Paenibacillus sp. RC73]|uniref:hypothetical protein n=1 Tax=Paenibacillus sp. RC73 TaxID=3156250 RepID=UPI003839A480